MKAPLKPGTRPVGAAKLAVEDTSTDGPVFAATPGVTARPRPQDRRDVCVHVHVKLTDKNLCRCFGAPVRRDFPDHLIITYLLLSVL